MYGKGFFGDQAALHQKEEDDMIINENEKSAPPDSDIQSIYKKDAKSEGLPTSETKGIPDNDAAAATIKHPLRGKIAKIQQDIHDASAAISSAQKNTRNLTKLCEQFDQMSVNIACSEQAKNKTTDLTDNKKTTRQRFFTEESKIIKQLKELIEKMNSSDDEKTFLTKESELSKKLREAIERIRSLDTGGKYSMEESESLKKIKEAIKDMNSSEWSLAGIRELISEFSTIVQFDIHAIQSVEENMKNKNMNLEIGAFSLTRLMEKAREALLGQANIDSDAVAGLLGLLNEQETENDTQEAPCVQSYPDEIS